MQRAMPDASPESPERAALTPLPALLAYVGLLIGFATIGFASQSRWIIPGLWITEALAIALPALIVLRAANARPGPWVGAAWPGWAALGLAALVALANQPVVSLLTWLAQRYAPDAWNADFLAKNRLLEVVFEGHAAGMVLAVTIAAPLGEELFFRGFAQPALARRWGAAPAIVVTGALFSAIHLDRIGFLGLWQLGILFGVLRWATGSIWPAVVAHAVNNALAAGAFMMGWQKPDDVPPPWMLWLGAALLAGSVALAVAILRRPTPRPAREEPWNAGELDPGVRLGRAAGLFALWLASVVAATVLLVQALNALRHTA